MAGVGVQSYLEVFEKIVLRLGSADFGLLGYSPIPTEDSRCDGVDGL